MTAAEYQRRREIIESAETYSEAAKKVGMTRPAMTAWAKNNGIKRKRFHRECSATIMHFERMLQKAKKKGYLKSGKDIMRVISILHNTNSVAGGAN